MKEKATFCDTCRKVALLIDGYYKYEKTKSDRKNGLPFRRRELESNGGTISLGTWKELQSRIECTSCQDIARSLVQGGREPPADDVLRFVDTGYGVLHISEYSKVGAYLQLRRLEVPNKTHEVGRLFNPQRVNVDLLRQWVCCCHTSHEQHCQEIEISSPLTSIYLIDVVKGCLTSATMETRYVALSYVWGDFNSIQTTKRNLMYLQRPGSIDASVSSLKYGKTIGDALRLVSLLGERYL